MAIQEVGSFFSGAPYRKDHGPELIGERDLKQEGLNCQAFVHLFYLKVLEISLDPSMKSKEIFQDEKSFRTVTEGEGPSLGDVYCVGSERTKPKDLHLAVVIGVNREGSLVLRHANKRDRQVTNTTLPELGERYRIIHAVKRSRRQLNTDLPVIEA